MAGQVPVTAERVPITLLTGFLGAGKSTLLNKILAHPASGRIAVIVNEFGDVGLDHELIEATSEDITLLSSGCICCTIRGDLVTAIPDLIARRARGELDFDRVVIETTGLADPGPIQRTLVTDPELSKLAVLDGIVTLADTVNGPDTLDRQFEAVSQAAMADLILLSKTDLATPKQVQAFRTRLERLNAAARIVEVAEAARSPDLIFGCSAVRKGVTFDEALAWIAPPDAAPASDPLAGLSGLVPGPAPAPSYGSHHEGRIQSASIVLEKPLTRKGLGDWLSNLTALRGQNILRIKGIVFLENEEVPTVFHGVQHVFDKPVPLKQWNKDDRRTRIVIIARDLSSNRLRRTLEKLRRA